ncbi:hypothetical protein GXW82_08785 [Streptacidiphilus sp. 4-A2]|nr:hypothetical protein [Streptacidiphilus sp. 4-A2]
MRLVPPRNRDTSLLWSASALNAASSWVMQVGIFVHVLHHSSATTLALVELIGTLPSLLWMPFAARSRTVVIRGDSPLPPWPCRPSACSPSW